MNLVKKQSGSAHMIIIVILSLALISTLGFVYYQNFIQKTDETTKNASKSGSNPDSNSTPESNSGTDYVDTTSPNAIVKKLLDSYLSFMNAPHTTKFSSDLLSDNLQTLVTNPNGEMQYVDQILLAQNMPTSFSVDESVINGGSSNVTVSLSFSGNIYRVVYKLILTEGGWKVDSVAEK